MMTTDLVSPAAAKTVFNSLTGEHTYDSSDRCSDKDKLGVTSVSKGG